MDPLALGAVVALLTVLVPFSGVSVGLLIVSAGFLPAFEGLASFELLPELFFGKLANFALLSIPMIIIMGAAISSTRAGADLYEALERWMTRVPDGLVVSHLGACAFCAAIGKMGIPEMRKRGYSDGVASGSIAADGTLGILIPPSVAMIVYGIATDIPLKTILKGSMPVTTHPAWAICSGRRRKYVPVEGLALASLPKTLPPQIAHAGFLWHG
jgi:TRAP-type mannitol/chloroaromatic compound transport system permease large subunit